MPEEPLPQTAQQGPNPQPVANDTFDKDLVKVDENTGALNTSYPIDIPPGRNNLQPDLNLVYNSQNNQQGDIFGEGWSINIPYIERLNRNGSDGLYSTSTVNYFTSSLDGEIVSTTTVTSTGSSYVARAENGTFDHYTFSSSADSWTMTDKNGTQYVFGSTADSQQSDPNNASDTYKWMLKQVTDTNNNTITYNYFRDSGQIYPSSTLYTGNGSSTGIFEVDFQRTASADDATSSAMGFPVSSNYRISEIDVKVNGSWVRKYVLGYGVGDNASTSILSSIAESGMNSQGTVVTLPSSTFAYQEQTAGWTTSSTWDPPLTFSDNGTDNGTELADVNGDSLADIISGYTDDGGSNSFAAYLDTGAGWVSSSTWDPPTPFADFGVDDGVRLVDLNGDGLLDILSGFNGTGGFSSGAWINTGSGWVSSSTWDPPMYFSNNGADSGLRIVDVNGDGLPDLIYGWGDSDANAHYDAWLNNGHGWTEDTAWDPPTTFVNSILPSDPGVRIADVNGDGLPDLLQGWSGWPCGDPSRP